MKLLIDWAALRRRGVAARDKAHARVTDPKSWLLPKQASSMAPPDVWTNADQDPVPVEKQTWTGSAFVTYWYSDLVSISTWSAASSVVAVGLTATDAVLITLVAALCNAVPTVLNGAIGADLHIPFPVAARASFGYWLSYFAVISRGILGLFWFGVQSAYGGDCVRQMLIALWPSFQSLPNHLPPSAGTTTQGMVAYLLYWLVQLPLLLIPTHRLQRLFLVKTVLVSPVALAMVIWVAARAGGGGSFFLEPASVHGSARAWLWLSSLTSVTGGYSTLVVNIPDFSRFSRTRGAQLWQLPFIPFFKVLVGVLGIVAASASRRLYGEPLWSPMDITARWQGSAGGRTAAFVCAAVWLLAQVSVNVSGNGISFANDITSLLPRFFNIRRGVVFAACVGGWALCPWLIIASAEAFLNFMSAYAIFMAPIGGILFCDYWLVKHRRYDVPALYDPRGIYRYRSGVNWRALATVVATIVPLLPALADKVTPDRVHIPGGLQHLFSVNWLYGFFLSVVLYYGFNFAFPHRGTLIDRVVPGYPESRGTSEEEREEHETAGTDPEKEEKEKEPGRVLATDSV